MTEAILPIETTRHLRNKDDKLFCTVCTLKKDKEKAIGIALCSEQDNFSRKIGRQLSYARACIAMETKRSSLLMNIESDIIEIVDPDSKIKEMVVYCAKPIYDLIQYKDFDKLVPHPMKSIYIKEDSE